MLALIPWLVFLHTLSALLFFLAHGTSVAMAFQVRKEKDFARIGAMLDLSMTTMGVMFIAFLAMGLTGLIMPFILQIWNKGWVHTSIILMIIVFVRMVMMNNNRYKHLRRMIGQYVSRVQGVIDAGNLFPILARHVRFAKMEFFADHRNRNR